MSDIPEKNMPAREEELPREAEGPDAGRESQTVQGGEAGGAPEDGALEQVEPQEVLTPEEQKLRDRREIIKAFGLLSQIGVTMLVCVALGMGFGWALDKLLGSSPWLLVFGAFLGGGAALKMMYELVMKK